MFCCSYQGEVLHRATRTKQLGTICAEKAWGKSRLTFLFTLGKHRVASRWRNVTLCNGGCKLLQSLRKVELNSASCNAAHTKKITSVASFRCILSPCNASATCNAKERNLKPDQTRSRWTWIVNRIDATMWRQSRIEARLTHSTHLSGFCSSIEYRHICMAPVVDSIWLPR